MKPTLARHDRLRAAFFPSSVDLKRRVVRGAGYTFFGVAIRIVLTMGSTAVLARLLMPEDYGLVALASIVTEFAAILNTISLSAILIQRKRLARIQCDTVFWFTVGMGVVAVFVLVAFAPLFARLLDDIRIVPLLRAMSILFLVEQLMVIQHVTMMRLMMFDLDLKVQVSALLARITVSIVGASLGWGPWALVAGSLAGTFLSVAYMWHAIPYRPRRRFQWSFLAANMKTSASMLGNGVMAYALGNIDYVIVGRRFGATELGFYQAAASLAAELRNRLAAPLQKVLFPAYSLVHGERERFERGVTTSLLLLASAVAPLGFGLSAVASEVISIIYGEKWLPAIPLLQALGIAGAMRAIFGMTNSIFYSINRTDVLFRLTLLGAPGRVLMIIIGSYWGALGVAYALTISQFSGFFGGAVAFRLGRIPIRYYWASLWPP
ncbi:MAG TPA: lipopolysaccharide biosynthesis protein, partial [Burkholderiales bacterium]|nr:lipopolysaccharide biosynthesis protein [Burkholderiales bacterium]